ncbi:MAG: Uma2 family endonuclease [Chitinophagaceae bacterium]|nr:MAG: Uma2 family endonuclease [Chitinophagaceae bacterium]
MENEVKEPAPKYQHISPDEYLAMERASDMKHEYYNGYVEAMSGASLKHNRIERNLSNHIGSFLNGNGCEWLPSNMRVSIPGRTAYLYPDSSIVCGDPELEDDRFDTLINPTVIFEILSPSTRKNDLTYKLSYYKQIASMREYIMIDSAIRAVHIYRRQKDNSWSVEQFSAASMGFFIETISRFIELEDVYHITGL